jgi:hypothetical protein
MQLKPVRSQPFVTTTVRQGVRPSPMVCLTAETVRREEAAGNLGRQRSAAVSH